MQKEPFLKRFVLSTKKLVTKIPRYSSKFSNKIYDNHQKLSILILRQRLKMTYREIIRYLEFNPLARAMLNLRSIPDHSTLVKFHNRLKPEILNSLLCDKRANIIAIDASGFQTNHMSYHYANQWHSQDKRKHRRYLKLTIAIDTNTQYIMANKIRLSPRHDTIDFPLVLRDLKCDYVVADRGYDSKKNRRFVLRQMKSYPQIPYRKISGRNYERISKPFEFHKEIYHQRSKVECVFSVIKRKYGSFVLSKSFENQKKELIFRLIAYNVDRKLILSLVLEGFHQSPNFGKDLNWSWFFLI
jgi:transposase